MTLILSQVAITYCCLLAIAKQCNVLDYGAVGDNVTEDTQAVQKAIDECHGNSIVLLPRGKVFYLRPIKLPSHTSLLIDGDIAAWRDIKTWPNSSARFCPTTPYQTPRRNITLAPQRESLIHSANATDINITGVGKIDGQGWRWWPLRTIGDYWHSCRPSLVEFGRRAPHYDSGVSNIRVEGVTLIDSPFWTFSGRGLQQAVIRHVTVITTGCGYAEAPNTDGFNIQGFNILIEHCIVRNGDDCVPIFPPSQNIAVRNISCECGNGLVAVVWPSMSAPGEAGTIKDVIFDGATFQQTSMAAAIKSLPSFSGGVSNITYKNFKLHKVKQAVMIDVYKQGTSISNTVAAASSFVSSTISSVTDVTIQNVTGDALSPGKLICASPQLQPQQKQSGCTQILFEDVVLNVSGSAAYTCQNAHGTESGSQPPPCNWQPTAKRELRTSLN